MLTETQTEPVKPLPQWRLSLPQRPLTGLTVLVIEDSRFASEAVRLLCLKSGARIRRADCLRSAARHLRTYRPAVVIVDLIGFATEKVRNHGPSIAKTFPLSSLQYVAS